MPVSNKSIYMTAECFETLTPMSFENEVIKYSNSRQAVQSSHP